MIHTLIFTLLTFLIPLHQTYQANAQSKATDLKLWAIYWALFALIRSFQWFIPFFSHTIFEFIFTLIFIWAYHETYKGALLIESSLKGLINQNDGARNAINMIGEKLGFFPLFESSPVIQKTKIN